ncbi:tail assembly chaperone [Periweissella ghanensis]|uniref:Phage protein n=1 Tax=Periweissella ghanensis TaxID=467997 RepID=A0ABN8BR23_9LACO|nr:tail assembly chaperone [Periweissella ghanensis]MCM0600363.1 hypothetical protein [Periweissella ghanensis]CAH0419280.1 hypothetical protein WGH24286_01728 [Periweissella ghanensis]
MQVTIKGTVYELKFNFKALFKTNKELSTIDENGNNMGDGATNLFTRLALGDSLAIADTIKVASNVGKVSDEDVFNAIDELTEDGTKLEEVLEELKEELKHSGFFVKSIQSQKKELEEALAMLKKKDESEQVSQQIMAVQRIVKLLNDNL